MLIPIAAYAPQEDLTAPARPKAELWRLLPAAIVIVALYLGPLMLLGVYLTERYGSLIASALFERIVHGDTPGGMLLLLWTFLGLALGPFAAVRLLHGRGAATLFGPSWRTLRTDFLRVFVPVLGLQLVMLPLTLHGADIRPGLNLTTFLLYLPFALPGILIQIGAEELVFRGYLQSQLAARFRMPAIWIGVPSALFAWGHHLPEEYGQNAWLITLWAAMFGAMAADLTARTGNLGAALAFHFANNAIALLVVGVAGNLDGLALWSLPLDLKDTDVTRPALMLDFATMIVSWLLARLSLRV
ncbi:MAG: CPBP family intramembrane glutamic endopeptidase [Albidovulum sp.]|uniref:CPBP family intramembrane glutamic endopeptidase n=1 Tax=Albidovulum sp. TaxID=1872424 RepID=UPI003C9BCAF3